MRNSKKSMKEVNLIAILGFCLICSPQAFGQNGDYIASRLVIESPKEPRILQEKTYKIYPFQEELCLSKPTTFPKIAQVADTEVGFHTSKPVMTNFRKFTRPKIIEEA